MFGVNKYICVHRYVYRYTLIVESKSKHIDRLYEHAAPAKHLLRPCDLRGDSGQPESSVTSSGTSGAATARAGEEYQVKVRYQVRGEPFDTDGCSVANQRQV